MTEGSLKMLPNFKWAICRPGEKPTTFYATAVRPRCKAALASQRLQSM
jgi:hypothetical protein